MSSEVTMGMPENNFGETDLWHSNDGNALRIRTRNAASVVARYDLGDTVSREVMSANVRTRVLGNASAQAEVQVWNFVHCAHLFRH